MQLYRLYLTALLNNFGSFLPPGISTLLVSAILFSPSGHNIPDNN